MRISIVVATADNGVIGSGGAMPWHLPADLAHFKQLTMGHPIIMGRVTHESIGRALPGRRNIVITSDKNYKAESCETAGSLDEALKLVENEDEAFVVGGASIYEQALSKADRIYLTKINTGAKGDRFFKYDSNDWKVTSKESHQPDDKNPHPYDFITLERS